MVLSLEDQMVDRVLFDPWVKGELAKVSAIPSKTGWSPLPSGFRQLMSSFPDLALATDCSSYDWTVQEWVVLELLECKLAQCGDCPVYKDLVRARFRQVLRDAVIRLPDGSRWQQQGWGLMKSGWLLTINVNSGTQFLNNALAWIRSHTGDIPEIWVMGDDVLLAWSDHYSQETFERALGELGVLVKRGNLIREFAGFRFGVVDGRYCVEPAYPEKHDFMLRHVSEPQREEVATAYMMLYSMSESAQGRLVREVVRPYAMLNPTLARAWAHGAKMPSAFRAPLCGR
uniref:RNA-dependent RNA polymerase n=1 Tax=Macrotermes natalensis sobeli-like virus 1 TaxID=3133513 RepID=A0AAT9JA40_9VIRU